MTRHDKSGAVVRLPVRARDAAPSGRPATASPPATILLFTGVQYERPRTERRWDGFRVEEAGRAS